MTEENYSIERFDNEIRFSGVFRVNETSEYAGFYNLIKEADEISRTTKEALVLNLKNIEYANQTFSMFLQGVVNHFYEKEGSPIVLIYSSCDYWQKSFCSSMRKVFSRIKIYDDCKHTPDIPFLSEE